MKKATMLFLTICLLLSSGITVFAGSVPEDLLHSDEAQIFFAEVVKCTKNGDETEVELIPVVAVKGDVPLRCQLTYQGVIAIGDFQFSKDKAYLFAYFDEHNPTYAFRATDYEPKTLSLILPEDMRCNMFGRFEEYLNNGGYTAAEKDRCHRLGLQPSVTQIDGELPPLDAEERRWVPVIAAGITVVAACGTVLGCVVWRKKKEKCKPNS